MKLLVSLLVLTNRAQDAVVDEPVVVAEPIPDQDLDHTFFEWLINEWYLIENDYRLNTSAVLMIIRTLYGMLVCGWIPSKVYFPRKQGVSFI